eukprot:800350-Prymnesium_polylepis.1
MELTSQFEGHSPFRFAKLTLFTCEWFRKFDVLIFLDADGIVVRPFFDEAIATLDARDDWMLMQDNGPSVGKTSFFRMEFVNGTPPTAARPHIFDMKNSGQTGIMLIKLHAMPPAKELERRLLWLYQMLPKNLQRHDDQTLILSAFEGKFSLFTMCLPFHVVE